MAWLKIEASVARNKKFVNAGPAPSWLWVCGLAYCQEGLTDGFIPREALPYLGVKNAPQMVTNLVRAGLWEVAEGGWRIHDYLDHNRSASDVADIRARRGAGGKGGGRGNKKPSGKPSERGEGLQPETLRQTFHAIQGNPSTATATTTVTEASPATATEHQERTTAAAPRNPAREPSSDGNFAVIQKIAADILSLQSFESEADLSEAVKSNCATLKIAYDSDVIARACASAKVVRLVAKVGA